MVRFWLCMLMHINCNHINKIEARYKVLSEVLLLSLRATFHTEPLVYLQT